VFENKHKQKRDVLDSR